MTFRSMQLLKQILLHNAFVNGLTRLKYVLNAQQIRIIKYIFIRRLLKAHAFSNTHKQTLYICIKELIFYFLCSSAACFINISAHF